MTDPASTQPVITLTTDFGEGAYYVASMKGAILSVNGRARIVDASHSIAPQNVRQGAFVLAQIAGNFPRATIHVAVIDPGVGTERKLVYAAMGGQHFLAPDNGVLGLVARSHPPERLIALEEPRWWRHPVSRTFHGRDILAPVAAHLSGGVDPGQLGPVLERLLPLDWPEPSTRPGGIDGDVLFADSFGNLISNVPAALLASAPRAGLRVTVGDHEITGLHGTYADVDPGTLLALVGSSGYLEIAVTGGSAAEVLGTSGPVPLRLTWKPR